MEERMPQDVQASKPPFDERDELYSNFTIEPGSNATPNAARMETLPGGPRISHGYETNEIHETLENELVTEDLNRLAPYFWLITTQSSKNIMSLTEQAVQGREITVTEDPGLHLIWLNQRILLKPLPKYLLSHSFWKHHLLSTSPHVSQEKQTKLLRAAQGFVRSYAYLIRHESDFCIAQDDKKRLVPKGISYERFNDFIAWFEKIDDTLVSPRYQVGELRLKRLNFWTKVLLFRRPYYRVKWQYAEYFAQFYAPLLFAFAVFSLVMNAMQLVLNVRSVLMLDASWLMFARAGQGFALFIVFLVAAVIAFFLITIAGMVVAEINHALRDLYHKRKEKKTPEDEERRDSTAQVPYK